MASNVSSAQSLLGLVTQLQSMELNLTSVLMEAALKLASLTDASIFFLVETPEGRRFAGRPHLCDAYQRGGLVPLAGDREVEADLNVSSLREKPRPFPEQDAFNMALSANHTSSSSPSTPTRKRPAPVSSASATISSPSKQPKCNAPPANPFSSAVVEPKREIVDVKAEIETFEIGDDDSDIEEIFEVEGVGPVTGFDPNGHLALNYDTQALDRCDTQGLDRGSSSQSELESEMEAWFWNDFLENNLKVAAVKSIVDAECLVEKTSNHRKLLSSVCYDLGKGYVEKFFSLRHVSRKILFDLLWGHLTNLHQFEHHVVSHKSRRVKLKTLCLDLFSSSVSYRRNVALGKSHAHNAAHPS